MVKYLENSFKFLVNNFMLAIPIYLVFAVASLVGGYSSYNIFSAKALNSGLLGGNPDIGMLTSLALSVLPAILGGYLVSALHFIADPITYGLVNKKLEAGRADLGSDSIPLLQKNFIKYVFFFLGNLVVGLCVSLVFLIVFLIFGLLILALKGFGAFLLVLAVIVLVIAAAVLYIHLSLWFPSMVVDNLSVIEGAKKSISLVKSSFWLILGFVVIIGIGTAVAQAILFFVGFIPLIGKLVLAALPAAQTFIMTYFYLTIYREKTGKSPC